MKGLIGRTLGHYRIVEQIGEGGMGVVYRARDERLDRDVAIKVLPEAVAGDSDRLARFEREAKAVAKLDHPNILAIHDFGSEEGVAYAVMELLEGQTLREVIAGGGLTTRKVAEYARAIADGLAAAHDKGIIHRDLKPENVFLSRDGRIKILDFGLAKLKLPETDLSTETPTETLDTAPGRLMGTVAYMAPEQVQGKPADHRSDIFALGVVLYEMLTGQRPFGGSTTMETAAAILKEDPEPISVAAPAVPPTLASVVSKCLEKRPEDRFSSAHDLALTLGAIDTETSFLPVRKRSVIGKRWPHILAVAIAAVIGLLVILPPEALVDRMTGTTDTPPIRSIALLPLENLTGDPNQDYFVDGLHEELISTFTRVSAFDKVIGRTSVMCFRDSDTSIREIGEVLDVDAVLEGSIRQAGETVRATLQLIDTRTEKNLWADSFDRDLTNILALQSDVARAVADEVRLTLTEQDEQGLAGRRAVNEEAYRAYLKGVRLSRWISPESNLDQALGLFQTAVEVDPGFADAHFGLSFALYQLGRLYRNPNDYLPQAYDEASKAVELDDDLAEAHAVLGAIELLSQWDWLSAEARLQRAFELKPSNYLAVQQSAYYYIAAGKPDNAISALNQALELDPLNVRLMSGLGFIYSLARRFDEGIEQMRSTLELYPADPMVHWVSTVNLVGAGRNEEAADDMARVFEIVPPFRENGLLLATLVLAQGRAGRTSDAAKNLDELEELSRRNYVPPSAMALAYISMGDNDRAIELFERAVEEHDTQLFFAVISYIADPLRDDPRFKAILRKMNLPMS